MNLVLWRIHWPFIGAEEMVHSSVAASSAPMGMLNSLICIFCVFFRPAKPALG